MSNKFNSGGGFDPMQNIVLMYGCPIEPFKSSSYVKPETTISVPKPDPEDIEEGLKPLLRDGILQEAVQKVQDSLLQYFPQDTEVLITKDCYKVQKKSQS